MIERVKKYNLEQHLLERGDRIVVGVSGGADSVCLLMILYELSKTEDYHLVVVHVNHMLRKGAAEEDEEYVKALCEERNIEYIIRRIPVAERAKKYGMSTEEAGRDARYEVFREICLQKRCNKIAIAHNKNDNVETFLFHLFRGSNLGGLSGMKPIRELDGGRSYIVRPLLFVLRSEIEEYLHHIGVSYQTDATNLENEYARNIIRNLLMPIANQVNQNSGNHIMEAAESIREADEYLLRKTMKAYSSCVVAKDEGKELLISSLLQEEELIQKRVIRMVIQELFHGLKDVTRIHIMDIYGLIDKQVGRTIDLPHAFFARRDYNCIWIGKKKDTENLPKEQLQISVTEFKEYEIPGKFHILVSLLTNVDEKDIPKKKYTKWFDYDKIENTVEIRTKQEGDSVSIRGGNKKLKQLFVDAKIPGEERDHIILIADGSDVLWILDDRLSMRISEKYKVTKHTKRVLCIEATELFGTGRSIYS